MRSNIWKAAGMLTILTVIAKVIAFGREMVIAYSYGAAFSTDAYFLAEGLAANIIYAFTAALSVAFVPLYIENKKAHSQDFVVTSLAAAGIVSACISGVVFLGSDKIAHIIAPAYDTVQLRQVALYIQILAIGMLFPLFTNIFSSILNAERIYGYTAFTGIIYSFTAILFSIVFCKSLGVLALVISIPVSYFLQCVVLFLRTRKVVSFCGKPNFRDTRMKSLLKMSLPILLSNTVVEINQTVDRLLAAGFGEGAVSALSYSKTLSSFLNSLFTSTIITVLFTELSYDAGRENLFTYIGTLKKGSLILLILSLPIVFVIIFSDYDIVNIVYGRGVFNEQAVILTSKAFACYSIVFPFTVLQAYLVKAFYALEDTISPMKNGIFCIVVNIILSILLSDQFGFEGIAVATSISTVIAVLLLLGRLKKKIGTMRIFRMKSMLKVLICSAGIIVILIIVNREIAWENSLLVVFRNTSICFFGYFAGLILIKCEEMEQIWRDIKTKFAGIVERRK